MINRIYQSLCVAVCALGIMACTNEDYKLYDVAQKDAVFFEYIDDKEEIVDSVDYVFDYNIAETHTIEVPVRLMGMPVDYERKVELAPIADKTDMVKDVHYRIESSVLPANEVETSIKIILLRGNDPELLERSFTLVVKLVENEDLRSVGQTEFTVTYSDIRPTVRPEWWNTWSPMPEYSYEAAQVFFKYFYEKAPQGNQEVFNKMILLYGDYFKKAKSIQGPLAMYSNFLERYVLVPMYADYKDTFTWQDIPN